jgi:hypothetical protein
MHGESPKMAHGATPTARTAGVDTRMAAKVSSAMIIVDPYLKSIVRFYVNR